LNSLNKHELIVFSADIAKITQQNITSHCFLDILSLLYVLLSGMFWSFRFFMYMEFALESFLRTRPGSDFRWTQST